MPETRRRFLATSFTAGISSVVAGFPSPIWCSSLERLLVDRPPGPPLPGGTFVRTLGFEGESRRSTERLRGRGLSGRYSIDMTSLSPDTLVTPTERFYVRTATPDTIDLSKPWLIQMHGHVEQPMEIPVVDLLPGARPMGVHLMECSGRGQSGLISACEWSGVPIAEVLDRAHPTARATRVLISGFDEHSDFDPDYDERGCEWAFTRDELEDSGAFLATHMNGEPLTNDHGFPIRLVVPGWYGCCCIKWLNEIRFVDDEEPATQHMRHFASRTLQDGVPRLARDFIPAEIDLAAAPVRVEQWNSVGSVVYRVVGILWGGKKTTDQLEIRFSRREEYVPVEEYSHETNRTWTLWSHVWRPRTSGRYEIRLRVNDACIRTRRLDSGYYRRRIEIKDV